MLTFIGRLLLVVINIILVLVSLAMLSVGIMLKFFGKVFESYFDSALDSIKSSSVATFDTPLDTSNFDFGEIFGTMAIVLIVAGSILLVISFFGCCGSCCNIKFMLICYSIVMSVVIIAQVVFVVMMFGYPDTTKGLVKSPLKSMLTDYQGLNGSNVESICWNLVMKEFQCCGTEDYNDFRSGTSWWGTVEHVTPLACCVTLPTTTAEADTCAGSNLQTVADLDKTKNNYEKGCVDAIWNKVLEQETVYIALGVTAIFLFQILLVVFALLVYCKDDDDKKVNPEAGHTHRNNRKQKAHVQPADNW